MPAKLHIATRSRTTLPPIGSGTAGCDGLLTAGRFTLPVRLLVLVLLYALTACGGSDLTGDSGMPGAVDPRPGSNGVPAHDGAAAFAADADELWLDEDTTLAGILTVSPATDVTFSVLRQPLNGTLNLQPDGAFVYIPNPEFFGDDALSFYAWRDAAGSRPATVKLHVRAQPDAPVIQADIVPVVEQGAAYLVRFLAADADADELVFDAVNLPSWLVLDPTEGLLTGIPTHADVGLHEGIEVGVGDPSGLRAALGPFSIEVIDINDSPTFNPSQFPTAMDAREMITVFVFPDDPDGDRVTVTTELNDFVDVEVRGGSIDVTAKDVVEVTHINLVVIAEDRQGSVTRESVPLTIYPVTKSGRGRTIVGRKFGAGVHLVVLGDGYKEDELAEYQADVRQLVRMMRRDPAVEAHFAAWNVHTLPIASVDSGIDDNVTEDFRDTEYNAAFYCADIPRLICADDAQIFSNALEEFPQLHQVVLLVNDPRYGGSGGAVAIASVTALDIALHELGHSVANLADEYSDTQVDPTTFAEFSEGEFANISHQNDPELVPWAHWIANRDRYPTQPGQAGIGIFEGAYYRVSGVYRPTSDSRMRSNDQFFGPVNGEQWALSVYRMARPVRDFGPTAQRIEAQAGVNLHFFVAPLFDENLQSVEWRLDGVKINSGDDPNTIDIMPTAGLHQVRLNVLDVSGRIRKPPPHEGSFQWQWQIIVQ